MREVCRFCMYYRPDEEYKGVIGICETETRRPTNVKQTCERFRGGAQKWLRSGKEVKEVKNEARPTLGELAEMVVNDVLEWRNRNEAD